MKKIFSILSLFLLIILISGCASKDYSINNLKVNSANIISGTVSKNSDNECTTIKVEATLKNGVIKQNISFNLDDYKYHFKDKNNGETFNFSENVNIEKSDYVDTNDFDVIIKSIICE